MPCRTFAFTLALTSVVTGASAALVTEPPRDGGVDGSAVALTEAVRPVPRAEARASLRGATLTAPIPASVALFGAALCGLGLVHRARG